MQPSLTRDSLLPKSVITTCLEKLPLLDIFINRRLRNFYTFMRSRFIFQILYRNAEEALSDSVTLYDAKEWAELKVNCGPTRNEITIDSWAWKRGCLKLEASPEPMSAWLKFCSALQVLRNIWKMRTCWRATRQFSSDWKLADIYGKYLAQHDRYIASIISNNQNNIMKALALVAN